MKIKDNGDIHLIKTTKGWFRFYRQGQRSWEAVCIVPKVRPDYSRGEGVSIHGNAVELMDKVLTSLDVIERHILKSEMEYRTAIMSIVATGEIGNKFKIEFLKDEDL